MSTSAEVSSRDSGETASTLGDGSAGGQDCFECSVPDCGTRLASHAGLMAHQRNVHGIHPSGPQTATASQQQRKRRADDMPSEQPAKIAANRGNVTAAGKPGTSTSGRFLCPVAGCTAQYCNRKDIYDHVQLAHQSKDSSNINLQSVKTCKEEVTDDGITFEKE
jgi:hypothetical protein